MSGRYDVIVLGGGPAGLSAAATVAEAGAATLLVDEQPALGGQIYRNVENAQPPVQDLLGPEYVSGRGLVERLRGSGAEVLLGSGIWTVSPGFEVGVIRSGAVTLLRSRLLVVATGAMERPVPFEGWTLPGVMTAGSAQVLLKGSASFPDGRILLAGAGPLLDLVALQLAKAGADLAGIVDLMPLRNRLRAAGDLGAMLGSRRDIVKGLGWRGELRRRNVERKAGIRLVRAEPAGARLSVTWDSRSGLQTEQVDWLLVHQGIIPNIQISSVLRCAHTWDDRQLSWRPERSESLESSVEGVFIAGDGGGIIGVEGAALEGVLAGTFAAERLGLPRRMADDRIGRLRARHRRLRQSRRFVDLLFVPAPAHRLPDDHVLACRCEEVSCGTIRQLARQGIYSANQVKFFARCGMGPCQGRQCGVTVTELLAHEAGRAPDEVGFFRIRPPLKPITLGELAQVARPTEAAEAFRT